MDFGKQATVTLIRFYPRAGFDWRMPGAKFQCSTTSQTSDYTDLFTIAATPRNNAWTEAPLPVAATCRYVRYLSAPDGYANVAEIQFLGPGG
jgi:hypothetical protein